MRIYLKRHILPYFGNTRNQKITTDQVEDWLLELRDKPSKAGPPLSPTTVNHCLTCLKVMLKEAVRRGYLVKSPSTGIKQFAEKPKKKSILTTDEMRELFLRENINRVWDRDVFHYTLNLLTASTLDY